VIKVTSHSKTTWTTRGILRTLRNPAYAENNLEMYEYFLRNGYQIANAPEEFDGKNGMGLYGKEKGKKDRKMISVSEQILAIGEFPPLVSSELWLKAQYKLIGKQTPPRSGTSKTTWLSGMLTCACCGFSMNVKYTKKRGKEYKYIHCRGRTDQGETVCTNGT
jgi:site-specific DNA recombinase